MTMNSLHSLARRGVDVAARAAVAEDPNKNVAIRISPLGALVFLTTFLGFIIALVLGAYTYGHVIPTLCMIESPETNVYVPVETISSSEEPPAYSEDDDGVPKTTEPEVLLVRNKPITSSTRQTILHLQARGGYMARYRGFGVWIVWDLLRNILVAILSIGSRNPIITSLTAILAEVALAHIHMTWIHVVISEPSEKRWYQRIPSLRGNWTKIAPAVLVWSVATQLVTILPILVCGSWGALKHMSDPDFEPGKKQIYITASQLFMALVLTLILFIGIQIPAAVTMVRVAASMLPDEDETIVPFDRSFGGKVTPSIIGGQGKIGLVEAWKSFPWQSRKRLLLVCAKAAAIIVSIWLFFSFVLAAEALAMFSDGELREIMKAFHGITLPQ